jgi:hypothetical protein
MQHVFATLHILRDLVGLWLRGSKFRFPKRTNQIHLPQPPARHKHPVGVPRRQIVSLEENLFY